MIKTTITIGIPVYNEAENILFLLNDLKSQINKNYSIEKIIIANDYSSDSTVSLVKSLNDDKIWIIDGKTRRGQAYRQNEIIKHTKSDILILLNGDIRIKNRDFIRKLIEPIVIEKIDLVSTFPSPHHFEHSNLLIKILENSVTIQERIFNKLRNGSNIYTCHGRARAFSNRFYKKLRFRESVGEDAYSYLACIHNSFQYRSIHDNSVKYYLPNNFLDYARQSSRFNKSRKLLMNHFPAELVTRELDIPSKLVLSETLRMILKKPMFTIIYIIINLIVKYSIDNSQNHDIWRVSKSTKVNPL